MNWWKNAAVAALLVAVATPAFAQGRGERRDRPRAEMRERMGGRGLGGGVEALLRNRESLKLTDAQVNQLEALRKEIVAQRQNEARDMIDLQSRIAAGHVDREEARKQMQSRREAMRNSLEQRRERLEKILTAEQREHLKEMRPPRGRAEFGPGRGRGGPPIPGRYRWN